MKYLLLFLLVGCSIKDFQSNQEPDSKATIDMRAAERFNILDTSDYKRLNCEGYINPNDIIPLPYKGCTYSFTKNNKKYIMLCTESACGNAYDVENYLK